MKQKILFLNPPTGLYVREDRCQSALKDFIIQFARPPHELLLMAAPCEAEGHICGVRDYPAERRPVAGVERDIVGFAPDHIVINATVPTLRDDLRWGKKIKTILPRARVIIRGGFTPQRAEDIMHMSNAPDFVFYGEDEYTLRDLIRSGVPGDVPGIVYRADGSCRKTKPRSFIRQLDELPRVNRDLIKNELYTRPDTCTRCALIEVGRGCPYQCVFCLAPAMHGSHPRYRSAENIVDEIDECVTRYDIRSFHFKSDCFTADTEWVAALCREIIRRGLSIEWFANSRVDTVNEALIRLMKESGCFALSFGTESGSEFILKKIGKNIHPRDSLNAISWCRVHGIKSYCYFIIGFPWDTRETIKETISFACRLNPAAVDFFFPYLFEGTSLAESVQPNGMDSKRHSYTDVQIGNNALTKKELIHLRKKALRTFYFRPRYVFGLARTLSRRQLGGVIGMGMRMLSKLL